jgi:hypothetical protein
VSSQLNLVFDNPEPGSGEARIYEMYLAEAGHAPQASPLHLAEGNTTPFFLSWGSDDFPRIVKSNEQMLAVLREQPGLVQAEVLPGFKHFDMALALEDASHPWVARLLDWVKHAGPPA